MLRSPSRGMRLAHRMRLPGSQNPSPQSNLGLNRGPNGLPESRPERRVLPGRPGNQGFTQSCPGPDPLTNPGDDLPFSVKGAAHGRAALVSESLVVERSTAAAPLETIPPRGPAAPTLSPQFRLDRLARRPGHRTPGGDPGSHGGPMPQDFSKAHDRAAWSH